MRKISIVLSVITLLVSCHKGIQYPNVQTQFAEDLSFRLGKWYSVSDTIGDSKLGINSLLDTIWFINDTLAGWTQLGGIHSPGTYEYLKTYIDPTSIYNLIIVAADPSVQGQMDTGTHQFGFNGDTMTIYWDFTTFPPQTERYVKMK